MSSCDAELQEALTVLDRCDGLAPALPLAGLGVASLVEKCEARADRCKLLKHQIQDLCGRRHWLIENAETIILAFFSHCWLDLRAQISTCLKSNAEMKPFERETVEGVFLGKKREEGGGLEREI